MNSLLFLVSLRDFVRTQAQIVAVRKTFGKTIKPHLGLGSAIFFSRKLISHLCTPGQKLTAGVRVTLFFTGVPQGKLRIEVNTIQKLIIHLCLMQPPV